MIELEPEDGYVNAGESVYITATFKALQTDVELTKASISTMVCSLYDADGTIINSRNNQDIYDTNGGTLAADGTLTLKLGPSDTELQDPDATSEIRRIELEWTWTDLDGDTGTGIQLLEFTVRPSGIGQEVTTTTSETIDQEGIKRVKTKHMEVEAFDPRIMQDVEAKESTKGNLPGFCSAQFCIGTPRSTRRFE